MRVVVSFLNFAAFAGTETYTLTVAQQLERLGHDVTVYTTSPGPMADFARAQGVRIADAPSQLPSGCDMVFAQDAATACELARRYPGAVRICAMHSVGNPIQTPPQLQGACHAIVVLNERVERRAEQLAWRPRIARLRQPIDLKRFGRPGASGRERERPRVLALGHLVGAARLELLETACTTNGFELVRVGGEGRLDAQPEFAIADAEIVVSLGRGALEAMAGGRAVYVHGPVGGDGWVTPDAYPVMERDGFSGRATDLVVTAERLCTDLGAFTPGMGESSRDLVWAHHSAADHAAELVRLATELDAAPAAPASPLDEIARLIRLEWYSFGRAERAIAEQGRSSAEAAELGRRLAELHNAYAELDRHHQVVQIAHRDKDEQIRALEAARREAEARLDALVSTQRWQLACRLARPADRLRALIRGGR